MFHTELLNYDSSSSVTIHDIIECIAFEITEIGTKNIYINR